MRASVFVFILLGLGFIAQIHAEASSAPALKYTAPQLTTSCEEALISSESMYVRLLRVFIERSRANPQLVGQILARIKNSPTPINPFIGATNVFERQMFESLQIELSKDISAQWPEIQTRLVQNQKKEKIENRDRESRAEEVSRILSFELAAKSPSSKEIWGLSTFTDHDRTFLAYGSMKKWDSAENETLLLEMNQESGELTPIQPQKFVGGLSAQFANGANNDFVLLGNDSSIRRVYHFDQKLNVTGECAFPNSEGMSLVRLRTGEVIAIDYFSAPFTIWRCENGEYKQGAKSLAPGKISDARIFELHGRMYAWGLVPKPDRYPRPIMYEITDDLSFKLIDLEKFPVSVMSVASGRYTPFQATVEPMTEIVRSNENNFFFEEKGGRLKFIKPAPSKASSQRMGGNKPQLFNGIEHDYIVDTTQEGLYAYRYLKGGSLEVVDHFETRGESTTLASWKNPDGRNFVLYMIEEALHIFSFDTNTGKFNLELRLAGLGDVKQKPILIPGRHGQVFVAIARTNNIDVYLLYKKLERAEP